MICAGILDHSQYGGHINLGNERQELVWACCVSVSALRDERAER